MSIASDIAMLKRIKKIADPYLRGAALQEFMLKLEKRQVFCSLSLEEIDAIEAPEEQLKKIYDNPESGCLMVFISMLVIVVVLIIWFNIF